MKAHGYQGKPSVLQREGGLREKKKGGKGKLKKIRAGFLWRPSPSSDYLDRLAGLILDEGGQGSVQKKPSSL